jgi:hypothetical protein
MPSRTEGPPFDTDSLIHSIINTYNQRIDETIFELMQITGSTTLRQVREKGYRLTVERNAGTTGTVISLWYSTKHIITYTVHFDAEDHKIKRDRKVNNLEENEGESQ